MIYAKKSGISPKGVRMQEAVLSAKQTGAAWNQKGMTGRKRKECMEETLYRTLRQYSRGRVPDGDMEKLLEIAMDCRKVKNYVYARYGGIGSLGKLYPGYDIQNEMTRCGLRAQLGMPSVYYHLAAAEALGDIRTQWACTTTKISSLVWKNEHLEAQEKQYLCQMLRRMDVLGGILSGRPAVFTGEPGERYEKLAGQVDTDRMGRYLCRQVRKIHRAESQAESLAGFPISERAYRYADHGIYISTKEKRKRVFIPLTDNNRYKSQMRIMLYPQEGRLEILVPVEKAVRTYGGNGKKTGIALGMHVMLTTDEGSRYGKELWELHSRYADYIRQHAVNCRRSGQENTGRRKYHAKKKRMEEGMHSHINGELNRFLEEIRPGTVYMAVPGVFPAGRDKRHNNSVTLWQRGYIRRRLEMKCRERGVRFVEVSGRNIAVTCSRCGGRGERRDGLFTCKACGYCTDEKANSAGNALWRGLEMERKQGKAGSGE